MWISNWNNYPHIEAEVCQINQADATQCINEGKSLIIRGNGRCYGDASLYHRIGSTLSFNAIVNFDRNRGLLTCQSGLLLSSVLERIVPDGWFLPVTPGTKFITTGGAVASDIHGKNHHVAGSFSNHVKKLVVLTGQGETIECSPGINSDLFWATCGGMGLTGLILEVTLQLTKINNAYIKGRQIKARDLNEIIALFSETCDWNYSVAWIDCLAKGKDLGRSILLLGEHALDSDITVRKKKRNKTLKPFIKVPFFTPSFLLNRATARLFNAAYFYKNSGRVVDQVVHYESFFYPLDFVTDWNRIYGRKGFLQYQFVIPLENSIDGLRRILSKIQISGLPTYLAVLKLFGEESGLISFPMKGFTLALDFPMSRGLFELLDELDLMVADMGGRIYLSKDARMKKEIFWATYPKATEFKTILKRYDPQNRFLSLMAQRLSLKN